ncbi:MAG: sulfotransferase domain-containing protein [Panacagrimonas sp.]
MKPIAWPVKRRELHNHHFDSTIWNDLKFRDDDVVISTWAKSGTTWTQQIVMQMIVGGDPELNTSELSPWLDMRVPPKDVKLPVVEAQTHRRVIKTHLPVDALVYSPKAKYLYIGRDGRDVLWSMYHHHVNASPLWYEALNDTPGRVGPAMERTSLSVREYWQEWMSRDGHPFWPYWENVRTWWEIRELPNLLMIHFNDLKRDLPGQMRRMATFLDIEVAPDRWDDILRYCSFDWMKRNGDKVAPLGGALWDGGGGTFINKGTNGRWADVLSAQDCAEYEARAVSELGPECARWLAQGG